MKITKGSLNGVYHLEPRVYEDARGYFFESFHQIKFRNCGIDLNFVQDNQSFSTKGTLRGLHFQNPVAQGKLIRVLHGEIFDVAVDIRQGSPTFGRWESQVLSARNKRQMLVPIGFAHGFQVLSETAEILYKCSDFYSPSHDHGILWSDPELAIDWPLDNPVLSEKDRTQPKLSEIDPAWLFPFSG